MGTDVNVFGDMSGQIVVGNNNTTVTGRPPAATARPIPPVPQDKRRRIFVSYVRADLDDVDRLVAALRTAGHEVWLDRDNLLPGMRWQQQIHAAIAAGDYFLACFSPNYWKPQSYMNEELVLAVERLRQMPRTRQWFIPALLQPCPLPDLPIGPGETLADAIQYADFAADWDRALHQVLATIAAA
jgi:hypothetical protein